MDRGEIPPHVHAHAQRNFVGWERMMSVDRLFHHDPLQFSTQYSEAGQSMAPMSMPNGIHNDMPLTEYSADPTSGKTTASSSVPAAFLLPDGHPDVCTLPSGEICDMLITHRSVSSPHLDLSSI